MARHNAPKIAWISPHAPPDSLPDTGTALAEPNGLLAAGGDLSPERLVHAYRHGVFPWYGEGQPILWWSPDPRQVLFPESLRTSRSLAKRIRNAGFEVSVDRDFEAVIRACAENRPGQDGTWITREMIEAYVDLHRRGVAHSVECWREGRLAGGLYGLALGRVFFGESMFSREPDASKVALHALCRLDLALVDCQMHTPHLARLGAVSIPRARFLEQVVRWRDAPARCFDSWRPACTTATEGAPR